jgi:hypothetical protein
MSSVPKYENTYLGAKFSTSVNGETDLRSIINWEDPRKSVGAFIGFLLGVYFFEPWMITLGLVIPFLKNIIVRTLSLSNSWSQSYDLELQRQRCKNLLRN